LKLMQELAQKVLFLSGWRRLAIAYLAGAIAALCLAPINALPVLFISFPIAIWLLDGTTSGQKRFNWSALKTAFAIGWAFGLGYFMAGFWWIGAAFFVESDDFLWALPFGVIGFPAALALFHGVGFAIARLLWSASDRRIFAFAAAMTTVEWLRGHILTGFPWNTLGQAFGGNDYTMQSASIVGLYGLTLLALVIFAAPATFGMANTSRQRWRLPIFALTLLALMFGFGAWRLQTTKVEMHANVKIRIMQPNLGQRAKHRMSGQDVLKHYLGLSDRASTPGTSGVSDVTHLVWPESPFPFLLAREPQALSQISGLLKPNTILITGAARSEDAGGNARAARYFNSIHVVGPDGVILDSYDKVHLVPFGEYLPFKEIFGKIGLKQFIEIPGGFESGARRKPLIVKGLPATVPLICYEAIFPDEILSGVQRPGLILNVTNDGWFGITTGPHQHLAQAKMRSVELGIPQIRAANTGISAIIDPLGTIIASLPLGSEGIIDSRLPKVVLSTLYAQWGDFFAMILLFSAYLLCIRAK
jgi:apolipoprotein N-acyltransferase